jgi:hypothetical protein
MIAAQIDGGVVTNIIEIDASNVEQFSRDIGLPLIALGDGQDVRLGDVYSEDQNAFYRPDDPEAADVDALRKQVHMLQQENTNMQIALTEVYETLMGVL